MPNTFIFFFRSLVLSFFNYKKEKMIISEIFNKFSYRYTEVEMKSFASPLRYFKSGLFLLWKRGDNNIKGAHENFTFDIQEYYLEGIKDYLKGLGKEDTEYIFRDKVFNESGIISKIMDSILLFGVFVVVFPVSIFNADKAKASLIMLELVEIQLLSRTLKKYNCKKLLIISPFEKDIIFFSYFIQKYHKIKVSFIPSCNPISTLYKRVICDTFIFTAPFQKKEYEKLKDDWIISGTEMWPPYGFNSIKLNKNNGNAKYAIGLVSSGMALRERLQHPSEYSKEDFLAEKELVEALKKLLVESDKYRLIIYLHPLEKSKKEYLDFCTEYYRGIFGGQVEFAPFEMPSKSNFDLCSIGISVYSSAQTERLYGGYKTLFAPMGYLKNFFQDERFDNISVQNFEDLRRILAEVSGMSDNDFFKSYNLTEYRWDYEHKKLI